MASNSEIIIAHNARLTALLDKITASGEIVYVDTQQTIKGLKIFSEMVGIANVNGTTDYLKHINNNFLISTSTGTNLLNIDEGLNKIYAFNKELAFKDDITPGGGSLSGNAIVNVSHDDDTGIFTFTREDGSSFDIDTLLEKVVTNFTYNENTQNLELKLEDGTVKYIPMTAFIDDYSGSEGDNITVSVSNDNKISAVIKTGTITKEQLTETVQATLNEVGSNSGKIDSILTTWDTKVDKVSGKGLSTNDYTTAEKNKLEGLSNYNDSDVRSLIGTKANANASNLSDDAVSSWKTKLGVVSIEYDESTKTINIITGG